MNTTKRIISVLLVILLTASFTMFALASGASGTTGDVSWCFDETSKTLTISGNGSMADYTGKMQPWAKHAYFIRKIVVESGVKRIGNYCFDALNNAESVELPDGLESIGRDAFAWCEFESVSIPDSVTRLEDECFLACSLRSVIIPGNVETIGRSAFHHCTNLQSVTIQNGVKTIEAEAFRMCYNIQCVTIPASVTEIGEQAFTECYDLPCVHYAGSKEEWDAITVGSGNSELLSAKIHYHDATSLPLCRWCGEVHLPDKPLQVIKGFFHRIAAALFGARYN